MEQSVSEWISLLEPIEQGFAHQSWHYWQGNGEGIQPEPPPGMSAARAKVLFYHVQSKNNGSTGHRKLNEKKPKSIRMTDELDSALDYEAARLSALLKQDISWSEYVLRCINAGRPQVMAFPNEHFDKPVFRS
jgi:hypothetical protein